jgi:hypothetical protein
MTDLLVVGGIAREIDIAAVGDHEIRLAGSALVAALVAAHLGARVSLAGSSAAATPRLCRSWRRRSGSM